MRIKMLKHDAEFITAVTNRKTFIADGFSDLGADDLNGVVSDQVAVLVVNFLEVIDVQHNERHRFVEVGGGHNGF